VLDFDAAAARSALLGFVYWVVNVPRVLVLVVVPGLFTEEQAQKQTTPIKQQLNIPSPLFVSSIPAPFRCCLVGITGTVAKTSDQWTLIWRISVLSAV